MKVADPLTTFVIPTIPGRKDVLERALGSLLAQSDPDWYAIVVGDGFQPFVPQAWMADDRLDFIEAPPSGSAGLTRNAGLEKVETRWCSFLDDDDYLDPRYVKWLRNTQAAPVTEGFGCVVFRMLHPELGVLPDKEQPEIKWGGVGISFSVRTALISEHNLKFIREVDPHNPEPGKAKNEDIHFLESLKRLNYRLYIHPEVAYFVGEKEPA